MDLLRTHRINRTTQLVAAAIAALAGAARPPAPSDLYTQNFPHNDQRRLGDLPGNGGMYCVPTAITNWFAYFANRGLPQPQTLDGPRYWQAQSNYQRVSNTIGAMGLLMGTTTEDGTTGTAGKIGADIYQHIATGNKITVTHYWCGTGDCPTPNRIAQQRALGGFVAACYGHYDQVSPGFYSRNGGHCITVVGMFGCSSGAMLNFRDPASDPVNSTQSTFFTHNATMTSVTAAFRSKSTNPWATDTRFRLAYGTDKFLDGWYVLTPKFALTPATVPGAINLLRPVVIEGTGAGNVQTFNTAPGTGPIQSLAMHPHVAEFCYTTAPAAGHPGGLFRVDPLSNTATQLLAGDFQHMDFNRHGELVVADGAMLKVLNVQANPPQVLASFELPSPPLSIAWDDDNDTLALLLPAIQASRVAAMRLSRDLSAVTPAALLPGNGAFLEGERSIACRPGTNQVFVCGTSAPAIFVYALGTAGPVLLETIQLPAGSTPSWVSADTNDSIYYASGGVLHELMQSAAAGWVPNPDSIFQGLHANGPVIIPRARTNHDPLLHEGPEYRNLEITDVAPGVPDCYVNCDNSTQAPVLNVADFTCFLQRFAAGDPYANCDDSTQTPVLNVADFTCFLQKFAAGCP